MAISVPKKWNCTYSTVRWEVLTLTFTILVGILPSSKLLGAEPVKKTPCFLRIILFRLNLEWQFTSTQDCFAKWRGRWETIQYISHESLEIWSAGSEKSSFGILRNLICRIWEIWSAGSEKSDLQDLRNQLLGFNERWLRLPGGDDVQVISVWVGERRV